MKITFRKLDKKDLHAFMELLRLFEDVFELTDFKMPSYTHLRRTLSNKSFMVFIAEANGKVIGGLTTYTLVQYYSPKPLVYIYDFAISTQHQRQRIGTHLLEALQDYCKVTGAEEIFVQADRADAHALAFYASTGGQPEEVVHFTYPL